MWHYTLANNDEMMKLVFDHLRNLSICVALLVAASWRFKHAGAGAYFWFDLAAAAVVGLAAFLLFLANTAHLGRHLHQMGFSMRGATWWSALPGALFAALAMPHIPHLLDIAR